MISHIEDSGKGSSVLVQFHNMFYLVIDILTEESCMIGSVCVGSGLR